MRKLLLPIVLFSYLLLLWGIIPLVVWQLNVVPMYREGKISESEMISQFTYLLKDFLMPFEWKLYSTFGSALIVVTWVILKGLAQRYYEDSY